jgi:TRAP-type C4-dicarboxylate transport system permease small subunit
VLQIPLAKEVGIIWQGRYILALVAVMIAACGVAMRSFDIDFRRTGRRALSVVLAILVFGHFYSFIYGMRRYVIGLHDESNWRDMLTAPQWQPPFGWIPLTVAYLAVLFVGAVLLYRTMTARNPVSPAPSTTPMEVRASNV